MAPREYRPPEAFRVALEQRLIPQPPRGPARIVIRLLCRRPYCRGSLALHPEGLAHGAD